MIVEPKKDSTNSESTTNSFQWIFLVYVPRSGSTFLSKQLAQASTHLLVFPELKTVEIAQRIGREKLKQLTPEQKLAEFVKDPRWASLNLEDDIAIKILEGCDTIQSIMTAIATHVAAKQGIQPHAVVIKNGPSIFADEAIRSEFGAEFKYLHIVRDARGSTASRLKRLSAFHEQADIRATDVWHLAKYWRKHTSLVNNVRQTHNNVVDVEYETLLKSTETELQRIFSELGIEQKQNPAAQTGFELSEHERRSKHANAEKPPIIERGLAWKRELSKADGIVIEKIVGDKIGRPHFLPKTNGFAISWCMFQAWIKHLKIDAKKAIKKIIGQRAI